MLLKILKTAVKVAVALAPEDETTDVPPKGKHLWFYEEWFEARGKRFNYIVRECPYTGEDEVIITEVY